MKQVKRLADRGEINILLIPFILVTIFFLGAGGFGLWAYTGRQEYKNEADKMVAAAVKTAKEQESIEKDKIYAEAEKSPLKSYSGPEQYGSLKLKYPKTWSAYIPETGTNSGKPFDAYFQPDVVPNAGTSTSVFALRVQIVNQPFSSVTNQFTGGVTSKVLTSAAYALPQLPNVVGIRLDGDFTSPKKFSGTMVILPLRDKTLQIWTENKNNLGDLTTSILPNITFIP